MVLSHGSFMIYENTEQLLLDGWG